MPPRPDRPRRPSTGGAKRGGSGASGRPGRPRDGGATGGGRASTPRRGGSGAPGRADRGDRPARSRDDRAGRPGEARGTGAARGERPGRRGEDRDAAAGQRRGGGGARPGAGRGDRDDRPRRPADRTGQGGARGRGARDDRDDRTGERRGPGAPRRGDRPTGRPEGRAGAWGGLARRAAGAGGSAAPTARGRLEDTSPSRAAEEFRAARAERAGRVERVVDDVRDAAAGAVRRGSAPERTPSAPKRTRSKVDAGELAAELGPVVGASTAPRLAARLADAARAFAAERHGDARRILKPLADRAPASAAVRELHGLTLYRLGRWADAVVELEAFRSITGAVDQHPVLADCYRALGRYDELEALWRELREVSPSAELVAEGRIVHAGALADRGLVREAIAEIEPAVRKVRKPQLHHLRLLYVLADLYERAGDLPRARTLFDRLVATDPTFADAAARRRAL